MRADRLVAALLVLQARGRVTAAELARELEISERTARRDLEGLAMAGIPVYSQPGRGGGWELVGGARTDLSGLTADEARALFLIAGPADATPEVRAALRKLVQALPATFREHAEAAASAVVHDPSGWDQTVPAAPDHLEELQRAVIEGVRVELDYRGRDGAHFVTHGAPAGARGQEQHAGTWSRKPRPANGPSGSAGCAPCASRPNRPCAPTTSTSPRRGAPSSRPWTRNAPRSGCSCAPRQGSSMSCAGCSARVSGSALSGRTGGPRWSCAPSPRRWWRANWPASPMDSRSWRRWACGDYLADIGRGLVRVNA